MVLPRAAKPATHLKRKPLAPQSPRARVQKLVNARSAAPPAVRALRIARVDPVFGRQPPSKLASALGLKPVQPSRNRGPAQPRDRSPHRKPLPPIARGRNASGNPSRVKNARDRSTSSRGPSKNARDRSTSSRSPSRSNSPGPQKPKPKRLPNLNKGSKDTVMTPPVASSVPSLPPVPRPPRTQPQIASTKASGMRAVIVRRQAAEVALRNAAAYRDADQLSEAISTARAAGVSIAIIREAEHVLAASRRAAAEVTLRKAMDCDWPELEYLVSCIDAAKVAGVSNVVILEAEDMLPRLGESAKQRRCAELVVEMCNAMNSKNPDEIARCIIAARAAGVPEAKLGQADAFLIQLREDIAAERAEARKKNAVTDLQNAINSRRISRLPQCIQEARDVNVENALLQNAELLLSTLRFEAALRDAIRSKNIEHLQSFISRSESEGLQLGVGRNLVKEAELVLQECRNEIKKRKDSDDSKASIENRGQVCLALLQASDDGRLLDALSQCWDAPGKTEIKVTCEDADFLTFGLTETENVEEIETEVEQPEVIKKNKKPASTDSLVVSALGDSKIDPHVVVQLAIPKTEEVARPVEKTRPLPEGKDSVQSEIEALRLENSALKLQLEMKASKDDKILADAKHDTEITLAEPETEPPHDVATPKKASSTKASPTSKPDMTCRKVLAKIDTETAFHSTARSEIARSYKQGRLASTLKMASTQKPDFESLRQMTLNMINEALGSGKFEEALQLAFDGGA